jgi:hypothetical protein
MCSLSPLDGPQRWGASTLNSTASNGAGLTAVPQQEAKAAQAPGLTMSQQVVPNTNSATGQAIAEKPILERGAFNFNNPEQAHAATQNLKALGLALQRIVGEIKSTQKNPMQLNRASQSVQDGGVLGVTFAIMAALAKLQQAQREQGLLSMQGARSAIEVLGHQKIAAMSKQAEKTYQAALTSAICDIVGGVGGMIPFVGTGIGDTIKGAGGIASAKLTHDADKANIEVTRWDQLMNLKNKDYELANDTWNNALSNFQAIKGAADQMVNELNQTQGKTISNI